jgi:predicted alpha/beta-fold hydrolase
MKQLNSILGNSHLNTIIPIYLTQNIKPEYTRERLITPDNDFIDLDWINKDNIDKPILVLFHGTEGNSKSHYARRIMFYLEQMGWRGVVPHFRGCSEELNVQPRFYHAGDFADMVWVLEKIKKSTHREIFAAGVSLGGNALLKFLGENPEQDLITAAMAISVPFDLNETIKVLDQGFNKHVYVKSFLQTLLPKMKEYAKQFGNIEIADHKIDTLDEFNNTYLCQFYGFKDAKDYYTQTSCRRFLKNISIPTLILQAENDPMIPVSAWPNKSELSNSIRFVSTKTGGHAGFINLSTNYKDALLKMPKFMLQYFNQFTNDYPTNSEEFGNMELNFMGD